MAYNVVIFLYYYYKMCAVTPCFLIKTSHCKINYILISTFRRVMEEQTRFPNQNLGPFSVFFSPQFDYPELFTINTN